MKKYLLAVAMIGLVAGLAYAQDQQPPANQAPAQPAAEAVSAGPVQPQEVSIYGEVKSVNMAAGSVAIQYYDYDSDEEKSIEIIVDAATKMENAKEVVDIKPGNWADVVYSVKDGKNIAKSIIVEKEEEAPAEMPKPEAMPQEALKQ